MMMENFIAAQAQTNKMMENFIAAQAQTNKDFLNQNIHTSEQIKKLTSKLDVLATHNRMLETQISQVAQQQASTSTPAGIFPGQPEQNPKGHVNAIILRSGTQYDGPADPRTKNPAMQPNTDEPTRGKMTKARKRRKIRVKRS
jgi:hypothetical protein